MGFVEAIKSCLSKYVTWQGRAPRSEYWWYWLFFLLVLLISGILDSVLGTHYKYESANGMVHAEGGVVSTPVLLALLLPGISVMVRRLHDKGKSGGWYWITLVPLAGYVIFIVWCCQRGTVGDNEYGPDPLLRSSNEI